MKNKDFKDSRLIDAFNYIDPKYISEVTDSLKLSNNSATPIIAKRRSWRHIAALAACVLLLGAVIPMITYILRHYPDIAAYFSDKTTEESEMLTEPETPPEETTATPPDTTEEETTAEETTAEETTAPPETTECTHSLYTATENVPTCTESATVNYQCSSCGHTWSEVLPALGHNFVNNICTRCGAKKENSGSEGLEYQAFGDYAVLVGIGTCTDPDIVIASEFQGLPVTEIWHEAFVGVKGMRSVRIPEGVTYIESHAFENCTDLRAVYLPASLENVVGSLMTHGFYNCPTIETIEIAEGGKKYYSTDNCLIERETGTLVFGCGKSSIPADGSVKAIGEYAFNGCRNLVSLALPAGVIHIRTGAFYGCKELRSLTLPKSLVTIRQKAFENCTLLTELTVPEGVTEIYNGAFRGCSKLKRVTLPSALTLIDSEAFLGTAIEIIAIPKGVKELGAVFSECEKLVSVTLPSGFEGFIGNTFAGCTSLKSLTLPKSVERIGMYTFYGCTALTDLCFEGSVKEWSAISKQERWNEGAAFTVIKCSDGDVEAIEYDGSRGLKYEISLDGKYAILVGIGTCTDKDIIVATTYNGIPVTRIGSYALYNCQFIESLTIPECVTIIHNEAFYLCKNLKKVTLPSTLEWIQDWAFAGCESLETVRIPDSVTQISIRAFSDCKNLSSLTIGAGVELIEESAFENCTSLGYVKFPKSLRLLANDAFSGCTSLTNIHYAGTIQEWNSVDSTGRDYGNTHVWYEGVPGEKINCTNGYIFISAISESEAYEAAREFLGIPKSQIGGKYVFATKIKDPSHLDCYKVALCEFIPDIGHMGEYEVLREVYVNQNTGECTEIVFDYPDIPEVFHGVIFNREKFIYVAQDYSNSEYTYKTEENYLKTFEISGEWLFGLSSQDYSLLDLDGDSFPELIFRNVPRNIDGLILRYYDGKIYGYRWGGDGLMTDGTNTWHENAGAVQVLDLIYFDGLLIKFREIMRYDFSEPQNVKYYVEGKEVTKEEYEKTAAKYDGEYLNYSPLDLYPIYVNPFPGG